MVAVPVANKYFSYFREFDACYFELSLRSFSTVKENAVVFVREEDARHASFFCGDHTACA